MKFCILVLGCLLAQNFAFAVDKFCKIELERQEALSPEVMKFRRGEFAVQSDTATIVSVEDKKPEDKYFGSFEFEIEDADNYAHSGFRRGEQFRQTFTAKVKSKSGKERTLKFALMFQAHPGENDWIEPYDSLTGEKVEIRNPAWVEVKLMEMKESGDEIVNISESVISYTEHELAAFAKRVNDEKIFNALSKARGDLEKVQELQQNPMLSIFTIYWNTYIFEKETEEASAVEVSFTLWNSKK